MTDSGICWKHKHNTQAKAIKAMNQALRNIGRKRGARNNKTNVYWCSICEAYHWGHKP